MATPSLRVLARPVPLQIRGTFVECDCTLTPDTAVEGIAVTVAAGAPADLIDPWQEAIQVGTKQGQLACRQRGERFREIRMEIMAFRTHDIDSVLVVARWAFDFVREDLRIHTDLVPPLSPHWRTPDVLAIARGIVTRKDFSALPLLADALEDAGCNDETILTHCRTVTGHDNSCWAVELALGIEALPIDR